MFIIRETFIAKPGHAGEFAKLMKAEMAGWEDFKGYVMLDVATNYNTIVVEYEMPNLSDFENMLTSHKKEQAKVKTIKPPAYTQLYDTGKREIFRIVE